MGRTLAKWAGLYLNSNILQWIYGTISKDLLITILSHSTTAAAAWTALEHIIVDSKPTRGIHLKQRFANAKLANFPNMDAYCHEVKNIADQLANVDAPVDNDALVLQIIASLSEQFDGIATILQQTAPLPDFYTTRSKLCMEESRKAAQSPQLPFILLSPPPGIQGVHRRSHDPPAVACQTIHHAVRGTVAAVAVVGLAADARTTHTLLMATTTTILPTLGPPHHGTHLQPPTPWLPTTTPLPPHPAPPTALASLAQTHIMPTPLPNAPIPLPTSNKPCTP